MSAKEPNVAPGWSEGDGSRELILTDHDLFVVRKVRVVAEEVGE